MWNKNIFKRVGMAVLLGCICAVGVGTTTAYFTDSDEAVNKFRTGDQEVGLQEPDWDPEEGDGVNMYPGYSVYKNPTIKNVTSDVHGPEPVYARMIISIKDQDGNLIEDEEALELIRTTIRFDSTYTGSYAEKGEGEIIMQGRIPGYSLSMLKDIPMINPLFSYDVKHSSENTLVCNYMGTDGEGILNIGEEAALFTAIVIPTDWGWEEMELAGDFILDIAQESIQAVGFDNQEAAFAALDEVTGREVIVE